jgi:Activator of Hsp90 ATPase homolog 1-like protein
LSDLCLKIKKMAKNDFNSSISANISAGEAVKKISHLPDWWGVQFTGSSEKQNDQFTIKMGGDSFFNFTVTELIPGKRVVWLVTDCNMPWYSDKKEWANTKLIFDLCENNGVTEVNFKHEGLTPDIECYKDCERGWTHWIKTSLFSYFTTGKGDFKQK